MEQLGVIQDPMAYQGSARRYRADSCAAVTRPVTAVGKHSNWSHSEDPSSTQKSWNFTNRSNCRMIHPWKYMGNIPPKKENKSCSELYDMNHAWIKLFLSTSATSKPAKSDSQVRPTFKVKYPRSWSYLRSLRLYLVFFGVFHQCSHSVVFPFHGVCLSDGLAWQNFWEIFSPHGESSHSGFLSLGVSARLELTD